MRKIVTVVIALWTGLWLPLSAQFLTGDTLRMMQYNLMYYTDNSGISECNATTNNMDNKDAALRTIFKYVQPDVLCVCEMGSALMYVNRLLDNDLNIDGITYYRHTPLTNYSGGHIANMLYYDSRKLSLADNYYITTSYRDINGYKMYYNSTDLSNGDTVFITFWIAHLKAGAGEENENARHVQTQRLMNRITSMGPPGNYVFSGDFNITDATQAAYQELVNYPNSLYRFYDPVNQPGHWNNNPQFASLHTQSTHTWSDGCFVTGGLDDRFDLILVSPYIYYGSRRVQVAGNTYHALGQDGNRFNGSIISPTNNSIPSDVANALYNQSDHLPVIVDFVLDAQLGIRENEIPAFLLKTTNPVNDRLTMELQISEPDMYDFEIYAIDGKRLTCFTRTLDAGIHQIHHPFDFSHGLYLLKVSNSKHQQQIKKIVK